jgi:hypothetical protein
MLLFFTGFLCLCPFDLDRMGWIIVVRRGFGFVLNWVLGCLRR